MCDRHVSLPARLLSDGKIYTFRLNCKDGISIGPRPKWSFASLIIAIYQDHIACTAYVHGHATSYIFSLHRRVLFIKRQLEVATDLNFNSPTHGFRRLRNFWRVVSHTSTATNRFHGESSAIQMNTRVYCNSLATAFAQSFRKITAERYPDNRIRRLTFSPRETNERRLF